MADTFLTLVKRNNCPATNYVRDFLTYHYTYSVVVDVDPSIPQSIQYYKWIAQSSFMFNPGDLNPQFGEGYCNPGVTISPMNTTNGESPRQFIITGVFEDTTDNALWTASGSLTQEIASLDHNNTPCKVPLPNLAPALLANNQKYQPIIAKLPKWQGQPYRKLVFYADNGAGALFTGVYRYQDKLDAMVGTINDDGWDGSNARTWLWAKSDVTTINGSLFKIEITWVYRFYTWDETSIWLYQAGNVPVDQVTGNPLLSPAIPSPPTFAASVVGLPAADGGTPAKGWGRFIMPYTAPWQDTFDTFSNDAPDLSTLPDAPD